MKRRFTLALLSIVFTVATIGCGGSVNVNGDCELGDGGSLNAPQSTCKNSPYQWQDEVLFVCENPLPLTEMNSLAFVQVGSFQFINYRGLWVNSISRVCIKNVGPTPIDTITQVNFTSTLSISEVAVSAPWPEDDRICADIPIIVGAESQEGLAVFIFSFPLELPVGGQYKFQIEKPTDITINDMEPEPVVGDFPITAELVTITQG